MRTAKDVKKKLHDAAKPRTQYAALPWRFAAEPEIMLLTSRETRRWVIPKGWPMKGLKPSAAAALEALEEAGLVGRIDRKPLGSYHYGKRLENGATLWCKVDVFPLEVTRRRKSWLEKRQRVTQWFSYPVAAEKVAEDELRELILAYGEALSETIPAALTQKA